MYAPVEMQKMKETNAPFFIELYALELRTGVTYIAACDEDVVYNGVTFIAVPFTRDEITRSGDNLFDECSITIGDMDDTKLAYIMNGFDFRGCRIQIAKIQYPDSLTNPDILLPVFIGYLDSPQYSDGKFTCALKSYFPNIKVPMREFQLQCNSNYGDSCCGMPNTKYKSIITAVQGDVILCRDSAPEPDFFRCGLATVMGETRNIVRSNANMIQVGLNFMQEGLVGKEITVERGCDKTKETCAKLGNLHHFSGFPAVPFESVYR